LDLDAWSNVSVRWHPI